MRITNLCAVAFAFWAGSLSAQAQFLDIFAVKARLDKMGEFDAICRKVADANRKGKGDEWIAYSEIYGEPGNHYFVSSRAKLADIEAAEKKFNAAIKEYVGPIEKFYGDYGRLVESFHTMIESQRPDLSSHVPSDPSASMAEIASARFLFLIGIDLKPGQSLENEMKMVKEALDKSDLKRASYVSQTLVGAPSNGYTVVLFLSSLDDVTGIPALRTVLGDGYADFQREVAAKCDRVQYRMLRIMPEWSNPPKAIADADPKFWNPKPMMPPKPKPAAAPKPEAKSGL
jgi:hypothetical protein